MGFLDKLKNVFFEEDEDEEDFEDTKPLKTPKKEEKIAKKVEIEKVEKEEKDKKEENKEQKEEKKEDKKIETSKTKLNTELIFDDDDFIFDTKPIEVVKEEPKKEIKKRETPDISKKTEIPKPKEEKIEIKKDKIESVKPKETYVYTKKVETKSRTFTPSPIISPIYGILDKNYKKEEVKENTEIRLSTRPSRVDFDSVRNKAFGDLEYDLFDDVKEENKNVESNDDMLEEEKREKNKKKIEKITKSEDNSKPTIDKVTIGEADEYYNDLGLAYNTDYKDLSKEQNDGKIDNKTKGDNLEDNLFDLIESMYDKED